MFQAHSALYHSPGSQLFLWLSLPQERKVGLKKCCLLVDISCNYNLITLNHAAADAKSLQSCLTRCDPIDSGPPGSPVPGILQARTLEWVAISFSNAWKWKVKVKSLSCVGLLATPWTAAYPASPFKGFSRREYWSGVPLPSPSHRHLNSQGLGFHWWQMPSGKVLEQGLSK